MQNNILQLICNYHKPCEFFTWHFFMKCPLFPWNKYNIIANQLHWTCSCKAIILLWTQFLIMYKIKYNNKVSNHNGEVIEYDSIQNTFKIRRIATFFQFWAMYACTNIQDWLSIVVISSQLIETNLPYYVHGCCNFPIIEVCSMIPLDMDKTSRIQIMTLCAQNIYCFSSIKYQLHNKMGTFNGMNLFIFLCWF
jgi:hypothetical protein